MQASEDEQPNLRVRDIDQCTPFQLSLLHGMSCPNTLLCLWEAEVISHVVVLETLCPPYCSGRDSATCKLQDTLM